MPWRAPALTTTPGVVVVAAAARLALTEGRTVEVVEVAMLASVDERTIRAAVQAGELRPLGPGRSRCGSLRNWCERTFTRMACRGSLRPKSPRFRKR